MEKDSPLLSICIPTYNRINYLKELVEDILLQPGYSAFTIELIIAQDRFKDGHFCKEIAEYGKTLAASLENVTYNLASKNLGLAGNWNNCTNLAKGEYCIILGDDDLFVAGALNTYLELIRKAKADIIFSNHLLIDDTGQVLENSYSNNEKFNRGDLNEGILLDPERKIWQNAIPISTAAIKTILLKKEKFKENLNTPEIEFFLRVWNNCQVSFYFHKGYLTKYRVHTQSATSNGLSIHRLFLWLKDVPVTRKNMVHKINFLNGLSVSAVNNLLREGNIEDAKQIHSSPFYKDRSLLKHKSIAQKFMLTFPFICRFLIK